MRGVSISSVLFLMVVFVIGGPAAWGELDGNECGFGSADGIASERSHSGQAAPNRLRKFDHSAASTRPHASGQRGQVVQEPPLTLLAGGPEPSPPTPTSSKSDALPNILLVVMDTVRWDCVSLAKNGMDTTPELARIAENAFVFTRTSSIYTHTPPSHFSMFTGVYDGHWAGFPARQEFDSPVNSLVTYLRELGYFTVGISANHLLSQSSFRYLRPFEFYCEATGQRLSSFDDDLDLRNRVADVRERYGVPVTDETLRLIAVNADDVLVPVEQALESKGDRPLFLFLNFMDAHDPYFPLGGSHNTDAEPQLEGFWSDLRTRPNPDWSLLVDDPARLNVLKGKLRCVSNQRWRISVDLNQAQLDLYKRRYQAEIRYLDSRIGALMRLLREHCAYEDPLIIITSDHGESFGEEDFLVHGMSGGGDPEATTHVPLLIVPGDQKLPHRIDIDKQVTIADIAPTILRWVGIEYDGSAATPKNGFGHGNDLSPLMSPYVQVRDIRFSCSLRRGGQQRSPAMDKDARERLRSLGYVD